MVNRFLKNFILFQDLTTDELERVADIIYNESYDKNEIIFWEEDRGDAIYIILDGLVKVFKTNDQGREKTLTLLSRGEFFGEMALLDNSLRSASVKAIKPCQLLIIERSKFKSLVAQYPAISLKIIAILSQRLRKANQQIQNLTFKSVRERLEDELKELAYKYGSEHKRGTLITKKITHQELANLVGTTRATVTKILNQMMENNELLIKDRYLILLD
ncbi:cAMP-binding protein [Halobacteroides halobius DSM 5150]|uniref:cAMP-binding protein n=1 Tax=Halobacteroides halobius (strain ATCC 35273 / DSM 5150 / MD-1) TaxID=748449 RepID=L0KB47_HALHC|nr:Crp/Fnr family transcriptional regulator [Halobacteroides halobius]AGB41283.1 cAMP-binding protein [Halobacteroides halobius DSM 5150]